jgi:hypothetical protein
VSAAIKFLAPKMPFLDQMLVSFFIVSALIIVISLFGKKQIENKGFEISRKLFSTDRIFNLLSIVIIIIFSAIYIIFW